MTNYSINVKQTVHITPTSSFGLQAIFDKNFQSRLQKNIQARLKMAGNDCVAYLKEQSAQIYWKRRYQRGWRATVKPLQLSLFNKEDHTIFIEKGRRPNSKPPPAAAIAEWVLDKLGPNVSPYLVARSISRKGILPRPVMLAPRTQDAMLAKVENHLYEAIRETTTR